MVYPYSGVFLGISRFLSSLFRDSLELSLLTSPFANKHLMNGYYSLGGAFLVNRDEYLKAGGENENFYGWGPEDYERFYRMEILNKEIVRIEGPLYHLFHTRGINSTYANKKLAIQCKEELCRICSMTTLELNNYIKTWRSY